MESQKRAGVQYKKKTCRFVSTNSGVIRNVAHNIFVPDYRMVPIRFEKLRDVVSPCMDGVKPLPAECVGEVSLNGHDSSRSEVVAKDPKRGDGLVKR
jgi:hypothetical protein